MCKQGNPHTVINLSLNLPVCIPGMSQNQTSLSEACEVANIIS